MKTPDTFTADEVRVFIDTLVKQYNYKKLPSHESKLAREFYEEKLPKDLKLSGDLDQELFTTKGTRVATGYKRIVVGDYGAFVEIPVDKVKKKVIVCQPGQEYRYEDPKYRDNVKYFWYTVLDGSNVKLYFQQKKVIYADYEPGYVYVSPYEIETNYQ